jgi:hypothetical protein
MRLPRDNQKLIAEGKTPHLAQVYLDGEYISHVHEVDDEEGWVKVLMVGDHGKQEHLREGKVEIRFEEEDRLLKKLQPGDMVRALIDYDEKGANVRAGDFGIVYREAEFHEPDTGPMVRWLVTEDGVPHPGGRCNVYEGVVVLHEDT